MLFYRLSLNLILFKNISFLETCVGDALKAVSKLEEKRSSPLSPAPANVTAILSIQL
jgi:hypothetical protein